MKKTGLLLLSFFHLVTLAGCNHLSISANAKLDDTSDFKYIQNLYIEEEVKFNKMVSYNEYSKYVTLATIKEAMSHIKIDMYTIANGITTDTVGLISADDKTGELIGASKTTVKQPYGLFAIVNGSQTSYIRGNTSYVDTHYKIKKSNNTTISLDEKYHMDIPDDNEYTKGVGSFFSINSADPNQNGFVSPYTFLDELKDNGLIQDQSTQIYVGSKNGITYYKIEFTNISVKFNEVTKHTFVLAMYKKQFYGLNLKEEFKIKGTDSTGILSFRVRPFSKTLKNVPTTFIGYQMTLEEYMNKLKQAIS